MKKLLFFLFATTLVIGCQNDIFEKTPVPIEFNIAYPGSTKATSSTFEAGDAIGLYAVEWLNGTQYPLQVGGNYLNNEIVSFNGTVWIPQRTLYWSENPCDFYAFYPFQSQIGSIEKYPFSLATDQNGNGYEASDLLYAKTENVSHSNGPVNLHFRHMLSKLVVVVLKGADFEGEIPDDIVAHVYNTTNDCTVNWITGSVEKNPLGSKPTITMKKVSNERFEAVLVPQNIERRTPLIELSMGGIAYLLETSLSFRPGYVHTITVTLNTSPDQELIEISIDPNTGTWN